MSDVSGIIKSLYSEFVLRDLLGYVVPGFIVLSCFALGIVPILQVDSNTLVPKQLLARDRVSRSIVAIMLCASCYLVGHGVVGVCFNTITPNRLYSYALSAFNNIVYQEHLGLWQSTLAAADVATSDRLNAQRERHAVLKQLTGHGSAACLISACMLIVAAVIRVFVFDKNTWKFWRKSFWSTIQPWGFWRTPLIIILSTITMWFGLWRQHVSSRVNQAHFEIPIIIDRAPTCPSREWQESVAKISEVFENRVKVLEKHYENRPIPDRYRDPRKAVITPAL